MTAGTTQGTTTLRNDAVTGTMFDLDGFTTEGTTASGVTEVTDVPTGTVTEALGFSGLHYLFKIGDFSAVSRFVRNGIKLRASNARWVPAHVERICPALHHACINSRLIKKKPTSIGCAVLFMCLDAHS